MSHHESARERRAKRATEPERPTQHNQTKPTGGLQRAVEAVRRAGNYAAAVLLARLDPGRPLQPAERERLERRLGDDLSGVRVVEGVEAQAAAGAIDATGFAAGETIVMGDTKGTDRERLLAHEAAHVLQQRAGNVASEISQPGDRHERAAENAVHASASGSVMHEASQGQAAVPAVQRQYMGDKLSRDQAMERITAYLERQHAKQGGQALRVTPDIRAMITRIFTGDVSKVLLLDSYFSRTTFPGTPAGVAADLKRYFPEFIDKSRLAHLEASSGPGPTRLERVQGAVEKTAPYESPEHQESKWKFDREGKDLRKGEDTIGPYSVDVLRLYNLGSELGKGATRAGAAAQQPRAYPSVETAVATIARDELTPAEAKGTATAANFADAQEVARGLARDLDMAQQKGEDSIALRLGNDYNRVKDRLDIAARVARIAILIRDALPHGASRVTKIELYYGNQIVRVISLAKKAE
jgi:hypothetical protein